MPIYGVCGFTVWIDYFAVASGQGVWCGPQPARTRPLDAKRWQIPLKYSGSQFIGSRRCLAASGRWCVTQLIRHGVTTIFGRNVRSKIGPFRGLSA